MSGNLGGGREGVMRSQYQSDSDMNRALLESGMLQQGFNQANTNANTAFNQQGQLFQGSNVLGADQQRMASLVPGLYGQDVSTLQGAGSNQQLHLGPRRSRSRCSVYMYMQCVGGDV